MGNLAWNLVWPLITEFFVLSAKSESVVWHEANKPWTFDLCRLPCFSLWDLKLKKSVGVSMGFHQMSWKTNHCLIDAIEDLTYSIINFEMKCPYMHGRLHKYLQCILLAGTCTLDVQDINIAKILHVGPALASCRLMGIFQRIWDAKRNNVLFCLLYHCGRKVQVWIMGMWFVLQKQTNYYSFIRHTFCCCAKNETNHSRGVSNHCLNLRTELDCWMWQIIYS